VYIHNTWSLDKFAQAVTLANSIPQGIGSNFGRDTDCRDRVLCLSLVPPDKCRFDTSY
jgi:hypothetical protein